jgi:hypothetical protein
MKKIKLDTSNLDQGDIEKHVAELADLSLRLHQNALAGASVTAELEEKLKPFREEYAARLAHLALDRNGLQRSYNEKHALVEAWSIAQKPLLFATKRSIEFLRGVIGFRLDAPSVDSLSKWTFTKAVQALKGRRWGKAYLTLREPVLNKEAIIRDRTALLAKGRLAEVGLTIAQEDRFYFEPKRETSDAVKEAA